MKTSNDLRAAKSQLFLVTILISFVTGCNTEEITPMTVDSQRNRVEENTGEAARRWWRAPTSIEVFCDWLKAKANRLLDEYKDDSTSNKRREEILTELREIGGAWKAGGCQAVYGDIVKVSPRQPLNPVEAAPTGGTVLK